MEELEPDEGAESRWESTERAVVATGVAIAVRVTNLCETFEALGNAVSILLPVEALTVKPGSSRTSLDITTRGRYGGNRSRLL